MTPSEPTRPKLPDDPSPTMLMRGDGPPTSTHFTVSLPTKRSFGDYELLSEVGRGGMGRVYKARQRSLGRIVALKTILSELATPALVQRFQKEAEAAAQLDHPGIVRVYKFDEQAGQHFFTMAFVDGRSLEQRLKHGPLDNRLAALVTQRVAEAVDHAHGKGVVHRDLKPGNVLLGHDGSVKVTDFGLARRLSIKEIDAGPMPETSTTAATVHRLTLVGTIMGTPGYIAPEQALDSSKAGPAADIWAIGSILYACLTGRPPFMAASAVETLAQAVQIEPSWPHELNQGVDSELELICLKCLRKDPTQRYTSAGELALDLAGWLDGQPIRSKRAGPLTRLQRYLDSWPELVPLLTGLAVHQLSNAQEGLLAGCTLAGISLASRRNAARIAVQTAFVGVAGFLIMLLVGNLVAGLWVKPFAMFASGVAVVTGLGTVACGAVGLGRLTPNGWSPRSIIGVSLGIAAGGLALALLAMHAAESLRQVNSPGEVSDIYARNWTPVAIGGFVLIAGALLIGLPAIAVIGLIRIAELAVPRSPSWRRAIVIGGGAVGLALTAWLGSALYGVWGEMFDGFNKLRIEPGSPWFDAVRAADRQLGRVASWFLAVALGLSIGGLMGVARRIATMATNPAGKQRSALPFILGAGFSAIVVQILLEGIRPSDPGETGRFGFFGSGPALASAEEWLAFLIHPFQSLAAPDMRWAAAAAIFWLKILLLTIPMALGGALAESAARIVGARRSS